LNGGVRRSDLQPILAGAVAALVGYASTFALVLAGLRAVGASTTEASSGLFALCLTMGVTGIALALRMRMPVTLAWSTPGAALLISSGDVPGGWPAAVGAFAVCGALIVGAGLWSALGRWLAAIPAPIAAAMLAGVLLPVCLAPVRAAVDLPAMALPAIAIWVAVALWDRRWAVPAAFVAVAVAVVVDPVSGAHATHVLPQVAWTTPRLDPGAIVGLALPLFVVTMASQNVPGMAVLSSYGYRPRLRPILLSTGAATVAGAPFGGHAVNLAAITAAMTANPDVHPDPGRRWLASAGAGTTYVVLALGSGLAGTLLAAAPPLLIEAVAGLALLAALAAALEAALRAAAHREAAVVTFVVSASAITVAGIGAPFWGLVAGLALTGLRRLAGTASSDAPTR
jgi:benzoate membrane transport protein